MSHKYSVEQLARGIIDHGISRLIDKCPFHVGILEQFKIQARPEVGTMAVTVSSDDVLLLHNPDFVVGLSVSELTNVLLHEVHHVLFGHVIADPAKYPDRWARTVAEEVTANEFINGPLPAGAIKLDRFPELTPLSSTDERYALLKQRTVREPITTPQVRVVTNSCMARAGGSSGGHTETCAAGSKKPVETGSQGVPESNAKEGGDLQSHVVADESERGAAGSQPCRSCSNKDAGGSGVPKAAKTVGTLDDHSVWAEARTNPRRAAEAIEAVIANAAAEVGMAKVPDALKANLQARGIGDTPGEDRYEVQGDRTGQLDWRRLLRRYVGQVIQVRPVFSRPPRRFPDLAGVIPGRCRQADRPKIMAVVDTSGSITPELLELIDAELAGLARHHTVTIVECDCEIQAVYSYRPLKSVKGRGGTDFQPPLDTKFLRKHLPDLVIYFTDGLGPAPSKPPRMPLVWCLTPEGKQPAQWGRVIEMQAPKRLTESNRA